MSENNSRAYMTIATVAIAVFAWLAWSEARQHNREQITLLRTQSEAALKAIQEERSQFSEERKRWIEEDRTAQTIREEEHELHEKARLIEQAPNLVILQCCNPRELTLEPLRDHNGRPTGPNHINLVHHTENLSEIPKTKGFVAMVKNVGGGPAFEARVNWKLKLAQQNDGTMLGKEQLDRAPYYSNYLWPKVIHIGNEAEIRTIPGIVSEDAELQLSWIEGEIELICIDSAGQEHSFLQQFNLAPFYDPLKPGFVTSDEEWGNSPVLRFHFNDLNGHIVSQPKTKMELKAHSVAKPIVP